MCIIHIHIYIMNICVHLYDFLIMDVMLNKDLNTIWISLNLAGCLREETFLSYILPYLQRLRYYLEYSK